MKSTMEWSQVARRIEEIGIEYPKALSREQQETLSFMAERLPRHGVIVADEVGTGKTRIACAVIKAVLDCGGRVAALVPRGLMHQWRAEFRILFGEAQAPKELTTLSQWLGEDSPSPSSEPEWWLISHGFRYPKVTSRSDWSIALPSLVQLYSESPDAREDGRTQLGRLARYVEHNASKWWRWHNLVRIAKRVAPQVDGAPELRSRLLSLPLFVPNGNNQLLCERFFGDGDARELVCELLGAWLGHFDLIVIDEAHKSREETLSDETGPSTRQATKLLPALLAMLQQEQEGRRICLSATPMELDAADWGDLLSRARTGARPEPVQRAVDELRQCLESAKTAPDQPATLRALMDAARRFEAVLKPFVTRRRLFGEAQLQELRAHRPQAWELAHPHRQVKRHLVSLRDLAESESTSWRTMLSALEGYSHAAQGLDAAVLGKTAQWAKLIYTKLANGLVSVDDLEDESWLTEIPSDLPPATAAKLERLKYWRRLFREARESLEQGARDAGVEGYDPNTEHPRILSAVEAIEAWTERAVSEKVLAFGVFTRPMRDLRDVLNARHCVRSIDQDAPIAFSLHENSRLLAIAFRSAERMRKAGRLTGKLRDAQLSIAEFRELAEKAHRRYERVQDAIAENVRVRIDARVVEQFSDLDARSRERLRGIIRTLVLDEWLAGGRSEPPRARVVDELVQEIWRDHILPATGTDEASAENEESNEDRCARLAEWINLEWDEVQGRQTGFCRLMDGNTKWETRRSLQAGFNRPNGFPRVLIAQSQVGREGLNLHKACRVVVQFHAEWNPAVLEQQIGRVDRLNSRWWQLYEEWKRDRGDQSMPLIEVRQVLLEGTYDAFQWERVGQRQHTFDATLFGSLLPAEAWESVPEGLREELRAAAPNFDPGRPRGRSRP
ncbi:helicase-related protein [Archangium lansingense]|uniref:helicase-related protein n=1 Tax=Archangium lansingense TaxID=2995310 RepID=UPI003B7DEC39